MRSLYAHEGFSLRYIGLAQNPTRYLLPAPAARWSHVSSLDGITLFWRDEREIEWTIPIIGLSTYFSKFSDQPGKRGWISFLETRKVFCFSISLKQPIFLFTYWTRSNKTAIKRFTSSQFKTAIDWLS